jgi:hypothetical protein
MRNGLGRRQLTVRLLAKAPVLTWSDSFIGSEEAAMMIGVGGAQDAACGSKLGREALVGHEEVGTDDLGRQCCCGGGGRDGNGAQVLDQKNYSGSTWKLVPRW